MFDPSHVCLFIFLERYMRGTIKRDEQLKLYRTFLTFLAPTICFTFKHLRWCLFVGKPHGKPLHGQGLPIELVPVARGPCTLALINVWWLYRWTKVSLPKWYFRCSSFFGNPNIYNPYQTYQWYIIWTRCIEIGLSYHEYDIIPFRSLTARPWKITGPP